jgi:hypothetical protein
MPIPTWRSYATIAWKKSKNYFREYLRAKTQRIPREAEHCHCNEQSRKIETENEKKEEPKVIDPYGRDSASAMPIDHPKKPEDCQVNLRPPIEVYEALDDAIENHLNQVNHGTETKTRKRSKIPRSRSVSSEERGEQSSSSSSSDRKKKIRSQENGKNGSSRKKKSL